MDGLFYCLGKEDGLFFFNPIPVYTTNGCFLLEDRRKISMYPWFVYLHILGIFGFLLAHGASAAAAFALRRERNLERVRVLLDLSTSTLSRFNPTRSPRLHPHPR